MKASKLFLKTQKELPHDADSINASFLQRAGYIHKLVAGVYSYLPLGFKVINKVINIIREEINAIGGQEIFMGSLQDSSVWQLSGRWDDSVNDVWFKSKLNSGGEVGFANTHEEPITKMLKSHIQSYKDLPVFVYQFQNKFRNELRAKSGIIRTREFIMKDLYSFSATEKELDEYYELVKNAYIKIFQRLGMGDKTYFTFASGGMFSQFSHEFQTICDAGEDVIYISDKKNIAINKEVYNDETLKMLGLKKEELRQEKSVEVGNIFKLKNKYSNPLGLTYTDSEGGVNDVIMGSYGIGPGRSMGTIVELFGTDNKINWPANVAPFDVHLIGLNLDDSEVAQSAKNEYERLIAEGKDVLFDDRVDARVGQKFADADLIGCPIKLVVSKKTVQSGKVEILES